MEENFFEQSMLEIIDDQDLRLFRGPNSISRPVLLARKLYKNIDKCLGTSKV